jgi:hypothetical protein
MKKTKNSEDTDVVSLLLDDLNIRFYLPIVFPR